MALPQEFGRLRPAPVRADEFAWIPPPPLVTAAGTVAGGAVLGAAVTAIEQVTHKRAVWCSGQFISPAPAGARLLLTVNVRAGGRSTAQATCEVGHRGQPVAFVAAALGERTTDFDTPPGCRPDDVLARGPRDGSVMSDAVGRGSTGLADLCEFRQLPAAADGAALRDMSRTSVRTRLWARIGGPGQRLLHCADLALLGDFALLALSDVLDRPYGAASLDNTVRFGPSTTGEWVLLDARVDQVIHGFAHLQANLWTQEGTLAATVSQSSIVRSPAA